MKMIFALLILPLLSYAQTPAGSQCQSQLMRLQIENNALNGVLSNSQALQERVLPPLRTYLGSDAFKSSFLTDYPLPAVGFPYDHVLCEREKNELARPAFRAVDCQDPNLCSNPAIDDAVKARLCFALPCSFVMGSRMGQCTRNALARPAHMNFTEPLKLKALTLEPQNVTIDGNNLRSCFKMTALRTQLSVGIDFENRGIAYEQIGLNNLELNLDGERQICLTARFDLSHVPVLSGVQLENVSGGPFVSDAMIDQALRGSTVSGLTGYSPETLQILKTTGLPPMARHFRSSIETAIAGVLSSTFEATVSGYLGGLGGQNTPAKVATAPDSIISELGVGNLNVKKYVDLLDCSLLKRERKPIPADHACMTADYAFLEHAITLSRVPTPERAIQLLRETMARNDNVTSESLRKRLLDMAPRFEALNVRPLYESQVRPIAQQISVNQSQSTLTSGVEFIGALSNQSQVNVSFCLPDLCDHERPSAHANRSIPGCPIQAYVDINELNNLLTAMYTSGRLCHKGRGDFVPERNSRGEIVRENGGLARGQGCLLSVEENPDGLRCYLNGAPQLRYDSATRRYNVSMRTKECFRGGVFIGAGKIGGDIDFNIGFTPTICNGGDFCLENGSAEWNVVPGTARYALRESSWLNGLVRGRIDANLREVISKSLRFPLASGQGPLANIPIEPEGRTDMGDGYFGACLKVR